MYECRLGEWWIGELGWWIHKNFPTLWLPQFLRYGRLEFGRAVKCFLGLYMYEWMHDRVDAWTYVFAAITNLHFLILDFFSLFHLMRYYDKRKLPNKQIFATKFNFIHLTYRLHSNHKGLWKTPPSAPECPITLPVAFWIPCLLVTKFSYAKFNHFYSKTSTFNIHPSPETAKIYLIKPCSQKKCKFILLNIQVFILFFF